VLNGVSTLIRQITFNVTSCLSSGSPLQRNEHQIQSKQNGVLHWSTFSSFDEQEGQGRSFPWRNQYVNF